ncbi:MAG: carboxypeptidase regulatory-like domain-containing protein [Bacteroidetes bacterium]|nr:carboxypeptidase regulatory-like domain-containing protein [Bacteroidota bacterium]
MSQFKSIKRPLVLALLMAGSYCGYSQQQKADTTEVVEKQDTVLPKGTISGQVLTEEGAPVSNAEVFVYNIDDIIGSSTTDSAGNYLTNRMFPGVYRVWVKSKGYNRKSIDSVQVVAWKDTKLDVRLSVFKTSEIPKPEQNNLLVVPVSNPATTMQRSNR